MSLCEPGFNIGLPRTVASFAFQSRKCQFFTGAYLHRLHIVDDLSMNVACMEADETLTYILLECLIVLVYTETLKARPSKEKTVRRIWLLRGLFGHWWRTCIGDIESSKSTNSESLCEEMTSTFSI